MQTILWRLWCVGYCVSSNMVFVCYEILIIGIEILITEVICKFNSIRLRINMNENNKY